MYFWGRLSVKNGCKEWVWDICSNMVLKMKVDYNFCCCEVENWDKWFGSKFMVRVGGNVMVFLEFEVDKKCYDVEYLFYLVNVG